MVARLIIGKKADLHKLQTIYSLSDALYLDEVLSLEEEAIFLSKEED